MSTDHHLTPWMAQKLRDTASAAFGRASKRGVPADIGLYGLARTLFLRQGGCCALTQEPFSEERFGGKGACYPHAPSMDRIDLNRGYVIGNCRLVWVACNFARNTWGDGVLSHVAHSLVYAEHYPREIEPLRDLRAFL